MQPSLLELQRAFARGVLDGEEQDILPRIVPREQAIARLAIYRNNVRANRLQALRSDYPVVERLVGAECFTQAAQRYAEQMPSRSADIAHYGRDFPDFLGALRELASLPYLPDVAALERAWLDTFLAPEHAEAPPDLAAVAPERLGSLRFKLHPASRLFQSRYPVLAIWQANQDDADEQEVSLDRGPDHLLIRRVAESVEMLRVTPAEFAWLTALAHGGTLEVAVDAAYTVDAQFDLSAALVRHLGHNLVTRIEGDQNEE